MPFSRHLPLFRLQSTSCRLYQTVWIYIRLQVSTVWSLFTSFADIFMKKKVLAYDVMNAWYKVLNLFFGTDDKGLSLLRKWRKNNEVPVQSKCVNYMWKQTTGSCLKVGGYFWLTCLIRSLSWRLCKYQGGIKALKVFFVPAVAIRPKTWYRKKIENKKYLSKRQTT